MALIRVEILPNFMFTRGKNMLTYFHWILWNLWRYVTNDVFFFYTIMYESSTSVRPSVCHAYEKSLTGVISYSPGSEDYHGPWYFYGPRIYWKMGVY